MVEQKSRVRLTVGRVTAFTFPKGAVTRNGEPLTQAFLWDTDAPSLALRVTPTGRKTYVFEARLEGATIRINIGSAADWGIEDARTKAKGLKMLVDGGTDPREVERQHQADKSAKVAADAAHAITVGEVWPRYLAEGRPKRRAAWKPRYRADIEAMAAPGGLPKKRGKGLTRPGPLFPLMALRLLAVNEDSLKAWYDTEAKAGAHQAARALMMFRGFLRWGAGRPELRAMVDRDAGKAAAIMESLPRNTRRTDALEPAQVADWWAEVEQSDNRTASVYLRALLLTGARREELAALKWADLDVPRSRMTIADKVEATRTIPLTPYLAQQLAILPRVNEFVFAAGGKAGRINDTRASHGKALQSAGLTGLTIHGLRRSFALLGEAAGAPAGAIAQVMGHKPSGTAEGYRPRSVDALRPYLAQVEAYILKEAGVQFVADAKPGKLRAVT